MDEEETYGPKFHQLSFKDAIDSGYLAPYEVIVLLHGGHENAVNSYKSTIDGEEAKTIDPRDCAKILGCWDALADPTTDGLDRDRNTGQINPDTKFSLLRSIAFCNKIKTSQLATKYMNGLVQNRITDSNHPDQLLDCEADHIDGKMNAFARSKKLEWLRNPDNNTARMLSNARCLTEGVDVPALDAVLFLDPKQSEIDVVQAVGRVMRTSPGKKKGYIVLPVLVKPGEDEVESIKSSEFNKVWSVLRALRAHDESFDALINTPNLLFEKLPIKIFTSRSTDGEGDGSDGIGEPQGATSDAEDIFQAHLPFQVQSKLIEGIFGKVADQQYWPRWAAEMADHIDVIQAQVTEEIAEYPEVSKRYEEFLASMKKTINGEMSEEDLTEMLAQHVVTLPIFETLFRGNSFALENPLSRAMSKMLDDLDSLGATDLRGEQEQRLKPFYKSVENTLAGIDDTDSESRLAILLELYENFFKIAMPKQFKQLGVAYTPLLLVDFVLRSVNQICRLEFEKGLTNKDVNVIEPFAGTGTFLHRLLTIRTDPNDDSSPYLVKDKDLERKYTRELYANEILLLAYFMSSVKIEEAYKQRNSGSSYTPFEGIVLTDTFNLTSHLQHDNTQLPLESGLNENSERTLRQSDKKMRIIVSNPPWSAGQKSEDDENRNTSHPELEGRIKETYVSNATATNKNSLYDSYVKALRWATDRISPEVGGVIGYIIPNSIIDGNTAAGVRATFAEEFSAAWIYNLRGNATTSGELRKKEGDNPFGSATKQGVSLIILVKKPDSSEPFKVHYREVADYLKLGQKFSSLKETQAAGLNPKDWRVIFPDKNHDWINQDQESFERLPELANKQGKSNKLDIIKGKEKRKDLQQVLAGLYSQGIKTNKDDWLYGFDETSLKGRLKRMLKYRENVRQELIRANSTGKDSIFKKLTTNTDLSKFKWVKKDRDKLKHDVKQKHKGPGEIMFSSKIVREVHYRPFVKTYLYYDYNLITLTYRIPLIFPTGVSNNTAISHTGKGATISFSTLATDTTPDLELTSKGQIHPRQACVEVVDLVQIDQGHRSQVTGHRSQVTGHRSQVTGQRGNLPHGEGSISSILSAGDERNPGSAPHGHESSNPALRTPGETMTSDNDTATSPLPGIDVSDLAAGNQPDADGKIDNISDWALSHFQENYKDNAITKDDIWHYIYGALHAQDWRDKYATELAKHLPRIPLVKNVVDFSKFCTSGETLMALHINYESIEPWPLRVEIDKNSYKGKSLTANSFNDPSAYRINPRMRWGRLPGASGSGHKTQDRSVLAVNGRCQIVGIPAVAGRPYRGDDALDTPLTASKDNTAQLNPYVVNGKTPLEWAIAQLQVTIAKKSGIVDDANKWHVWEADEDAHELVLHLLRLVRVSVETARIVDNLPSMPLADD